MRRLRSHQKLMLAYAMHVQHPALLAQMRLGKSVIPIRRARIGEPRDPARGMRCLIVAPNSALDSWEDELEIEGEREVTRLLGSRGERLTALARNAGRWTLINKEGWRVLPEIAARSRCTYCRGSGKLRPTYGLCVVNEHKDAYDVYIGRGSKWGNPYEIGKDGTRLECIAQYRAYLLTQPSLIDDLPELANKRLGCFCAPAPCHGDVLIAEVRRRVRAKVCRICHGIGYMAAGRTRWDHVIVDESFLRNPRSGVTKFFLSSFRDVPHRWLLTGLANPESRLEYWPQLAWLDGDAFGHRTFWSFRAGCFEPDEYGYGWREKPNVARQIDDAVGRRAFVVTRAVVGLDREKRYARRVLDMPSGIRQQYDDMEREFCRQAADGTRDETIWATTRWTWLRQLCGGFIDGRLVWKGPVEELVTLVTGELSRESVVVWFAYLPEMDACAKALCGAGVQYGLLNGSIPAAARRTIVRTFARRETRVLLVQEDLGKTGLNLSVATTAIYYSNAPSLDARSQSEDRILSISESGPLLYLDLVVRNTVSEDVRDTLTQKRWRSDASIRRAVLARMGERHA